MPDPLGSISPRLLGICKYAPARLRDLDGGILYEWENGKF